MSKYDVNYSKLSVLLLPMCLRGGRVQAMASILMSPMVSLRNELVDFKEEKHYRLTHNSQTCYMRAVLNDRFDPKERGITITEEGDDEQPLVLHNRETSLFLRVKRREFGSSRLFRRGYGGIGNIGFWVNIPSRLKKNIGIDLVRAVVDVYKLAGVRYGVTYKD